MNPRPYPFRHVNLIKNVVWFFSKILAPPKGQKNLGLGWSISVNLIFIILTWKQVFWLLWVLSFLSYFGGRKLGQCSKNNRYISYKQVHREGYSKFCPIIIKPFFKTLNKIDTYVSISIKKSFFGRKRWKVLFVFLYINGKNTY